MGEAVEGARRVSAGERGGTGETLVDLVLFEPVIRFKTVSFAGVARSVEYVTNRKQWQFLYAVHICTRIFRSHNMLRIRGTFS